MKKAINTPYTVPNLPKKKVALLELAFTKAKDDGINRVAEYPNKGTLINTKPTELAAGSVDAGVMINIGQYEIAKANSAQIKPKIISSCKTSCLAWGLVNTQNTTFKKEQSVL
ncbi:conserved hypothetical protein [Alteromonas sp. 38]|uniref:hypothetical protein n=1 Tax=Alteromonas TaxID=226 RepID=UPI0012F1BF55|nr:MULTISPECIES: hypothetical protein [Alteromonas]CAD5274163.1 conserved hypothetical protein [Alteromonas sp. 154]VXB59518.1 conserved hypothetical protein [Alteromonas sp. 38]